MTHLSSELQPSCPGSVTDATLFPASDAGEPRRCQPPPRGNRSGAVREWEGGWGVKGGDVGGEREM